MRVIIAGSRCFTDFSLVNSAMDVAEAAGIVPTVVLSGCASGVDKLGERWAQQRFRVDKVALERHPADWSAHGRVAGVLRNTHMADNADALVAIWDGESRGTKDMLKKAKDRGLRIVCVTIWWD